LLERSPSVAASVLHLIQREVGVGQKRADTAALVRGTEGDPQTSGKRHPFAFDLERISQCFHDPGEKGVFILDLRHEQAELVSPETDQGVRFPKNVLEASRHLHQEIVARRMSQTVVHLLEAVEDPGVFRKLSTGISTARTTPGKPLF
jgi:hypothetical protein